MKFKEDNSENNKTSIRLHFIEESEKIEDIIPFEIDNSNLKIERKNSSFDSSEEIMLKSFGKINTNE